MEIRFEKVQIEQAKILLKIAKETFVHTYAHLNDPIEFQKYLDTTFKLSIITDEIENSKNHYYFGKKGKEIVSYFQARESPIHSNTHNSNYLEIARFYVLKKYKGQGIGRQMMEFNMALAKKLQKNEIRLGVWQENPNAIKFYQTLGFEIKGNQTFMIGDDKQTDHIMKFHL